MNILNLQWVMTTSPKKGICNIQPENLNVKLMAKRLELAGNRGYTAQFKYNKVNSKAAGYSTMELVDYSVDEKSCYMRFQSSIGEVEILGEEQ